MQSFNMYLLDLFRAYPDRVCLYSFFLSAVGCCSYATDVLYDNRHAKGFYLSAVQASS